LDRQFESKRTADVDRVGHRLEVARRHRSTTASVYDAPGDGASIGFGVFDAEFGTRPTRIRRAARLPSVVEPARPVDRIQRGVDRPDWTGRGGNGGGLPRALRRGVERLSGFDMSGVRVQYDSSKPARIGALAYTRGQDIEVAPGQEHCLPHEAWHVVQQMQGRVRPTIQAKGVEVNDDTALEREADVMGARAQRAAAGPIGPLRAPLDRDGPIQRKVGFEYEIGAISATKVKLIGGRTKLDKKDVLVNGVGYNVEADEETVGDPNYAHPSYSGYSDLEFVTDAFPVTVAGFGLLTAALTEIADIIAYIATHANTDIPASNLPHGAAKANRFVRFGAAGVMTGKPQATVGLSLSAMNDFFQQVSQNPVGVGAATGAQELFGGGVDVYGASTGGTTAATGLPSVTAARVAARAGIDETLPTDQHTVEMEALVTQLVLYLVAGEQGVPGYGKTIGGSFMMRTAFDRVYRAVPAAGRVLTDARPDVFALMVGRAARHVNANITDNDDVFSGGIYNDNYKYGPMSAEAKSAAQRQALTGNLRRRDWLVGIASGTDRLTQLHFPSQRKRDLKEIESLGSYDQNTDLLGAQHLPLLEFRGLPQIPTGLFPVMAMDIFRYVFTMNTAGGGGNPGDLQAIGAVARGILVDPTDVNFAVEVGNAVAAAAAAVVAWGAASGGD
jgi:hypothetical protein